MTRFNSYEKFTISSKPVMVSYVHAGIFVPVFDLAPGTERFTFSPLGNTATRLMYWDEEAYVSELMLSNRENEKLAAPTEPEVSAADKAAAAAEKEGLVKAGKESEARAKKRKAEASAAASKKKVMWVTPAIGTFIDICRRHPHIFNSGVTDTPNCMASTLNRRMTPTQTTLPPIKAEGDQPPLSRTNDRLNRTPTWIRNVAISAPANSRRKPKSTSMIVSASCIETTSKMMS